ncbi:hypothetical protein RIR_jg16209.t1 [Rhizophagus irregularis DAOM 181602=DAOM 197198]|nr:hypothetical protein RIR_jg16209.t1 [Rhizophagus irregularis DAOM 181602=DAOM 197198]
MLSMTTIFCFFALHSPRNVVISSSSSRWNLGLQSRSWLFLHSSHSYNSLKYSQEIGIVEYWHQKGMDLNSEWYSFRDDLLEKIYANVFGCDHEDWSTQMIQQDDLLRNKPVNNSYDCGEEYGYKEYDKMGPTAKLFSEK